MNLGVYQGMYKSDMKPEKKLKKYIIECSR